MRARNRVGIGLSYRLDRLHRLEESISGLFKSLKNPGSDKRGVTGEGGGPRNGT